MSLTQTEIRAGKISPDYMYHGLPTFTAGTHNVYVVLSLPSKGKKIRADVNLLSVSLSGPQKSHFHC